MEDDRPGQWSRWKIMLDHTLQQFKIAINKHSTTSTNSRCISELQEKNIHCHVLSENSIFLSQKKQTCQMSWESKGTPPMPPPHWFPLTIGFPTAYPWIPMKMESDASWTHRLTHLEPSLRFASSQFSKALALGKPRSPYVSRRLVGSKFAGTKRKGGKVDI